VTARPRDVGLQTCPQCTTQLAPGLLACPTCGRLRHADRLKAIASEADTRRHTGDLVAALAAWREALDLLPPGTRQADAVAERIAALSKEIDEGAGTATRPRPAWAARAGLVGAAALLLWKFKFVIGFLATKGKVLLLGLTKGGTLVSMLASLGVYWAVWGWKFALGLVLSIYVHEMGHVVALTRFGIPATAPMFIPGVGAVIRSRFYPRDERAQARVGLAGPIWGLGAAGIAWLVFLATGWAAWGAIARVGAWINLFNLLPVWQLDGALVSVPIGALR
jgi:Zn-dependent protease